MMLLALAAHAASVYTPEDLVFAYETGLPFTTVAAVAASVGTDELTTVYLLRRGVDEATLASWGYEVTVAARVAAANLGALPVAPPGVSDTDWREIAELPTGIERVAGPNVGGLPLVVVPTHTILQDGDVAFLVERAEARDVWVDSRPIDSVLYEDDPEDEALPGVPQRVRHMRRAQTGIAAGALLAVAGGVSLAGGLKGSGPFYTTELTCCVGAMDQYWSQELVPSSPNPVLIGAGALGLLGATLSFHFGAQELRLAGAYPEGWEPEE